MPVSLPVPPSASPTNATTANVKPPSPETLHHQLLLTFATATQAALNRLHQAAQGQSTFSSDADLKASLALLHLLPDLLPLLKKHRAPYDRTHEDFSIPLIPICSICGAGPGAHHPYECPKTPTAPHAAEL